MNLGLMANMSSFSFELNSSLTSPHTAITYAGAWDALQALDAALAAADAAQPPFACVGARDTPDLKT